MTPVVHLNGEVLTCKVDIWRDQLTKIDHIVITSPELEAASRILPEVSKAVSLDSAVRSWHKEEA